MKQHLPSDMFRKPLRQLLSDTRRGAAYAVSIQEFGAFLKQYPNSVRTIFTQEEIAYCKNRLFSLAGRFAAKKAIQKALSKRIPYTEINILSSPSRQPVVLFSERVLSLPTFKEVANISLSISHDEDVAVAFAAYTTKHQTKKHIQVGLDIATQSRLSALTVQQKKQLFSYITASGVKKDIRTLADMWTGKEAVSKALGTGLWQGVSFQDIEIVYKKSMPQVKLTRSALTLAEKKGLIQWKISFLHSFDATLAFVVATG